MNKRWISLPTIAVLSMGLTACSDNNDEDIASAATPQETPTPASQETPVSVSIPQETLKGIESISFDEIATAESADEKAKLLNTKKVTINDKEQTIDFTSLMATGHQDNGEIFGLIKDKNDQAIKFEDGSNYICNGTNGAQGSGLDFSSILQQNGTLYMVNQFECNVGAMYMFELAQDAVTGALSPKKDTLKFISQKSEFGGFVHCAGQATPWNSHLGSEEYESDARAVEANADANGITGNKYYDETAKFFGGDATKLNPYFTDGYQRLKSNQTVALNIQSTILWVDFLMNWPM